MGAWHRRGGEGLQERHVHRKFLCGSLSVCWQHFNGGLITIMDTGERTRREHTLTHSQAHNEPPRACKRNSVAKITRTQTCTLCPLSFVLSCFFSSAFSSSLTTGEELVWVLKK